MNKKASSPHVPHLPLHLEILKDFSVIGAADLAALAAYDHIHRNDEAPLVRIETPTSENRYINHIVKQAAASRIALRKVAVGTDALSAKDGAYTRSLSHMPSEKDSIVKAAATKEKDSLAKTVAKGMIPAGIGAGVLAAPGLYMAAKGHFNKSTAERDLGLGIASLGGSVGMLGGSIYDMAKQSEYRYISQEEKDNNHHFLRNMALGAAAVSSPRLIRNIRITKALNKHDNSINELLSNRNKAIDFNNTMPDWTDPRRIDVDAIEHELSVAKLNRLKASVDLNTDYINPALAGGVLGAAASKVSSMRQASREKQASDSEQTPYTTHYGRNAALTGAALSVPGLAYAGNAALHLNDPRVLGRLIALQGTAIGGVGALAGAATGAGLGLAATGVNHYLHRAREKQASDQEQTPYTTHYARNSLLAAGAAGATQIPGARKSYKEALEHAEQVRKHHERVTRYNGMQSAYYDIRNNPHLPFGTPLTRSLDLKIDEVGSDLAHYSAGRDHFASLSDQALDEAANKAVRGGKLALGAGGLALAATGVNHYLHRAREKQAGWFSSGVDEVADVAIGTKNLTGSFTNHLTGRNVKDHMIDVTHPKNGKAVHELNKKTDEERYALTGEGSPEHAKLHELIQKRKASRVLAGGVVSAGVLNYSNDTNHSGQNYGMVYQ